MKFLKTEEKQRREYLLWAMAEKKGEMVVVVVVAAAVVVVVVGVAIQLTYVVPIEEAIKLAGQYYKKALLLVPK